jgi:hypothetical protein
MEAAALLDGLDLCPGKCSPHPSLLIKKNLSTSFVDFFLCILLLPIPYLCWDVSRHVPLQPRMMQDWEYTPGSFLSNHNPPTLQCQMMKICKDFNTRIWKKIICVLSHVCSVQVHRENWSKVLQEVLLVQSEVLEKDHVGAD